MLSCPNTLFSLGFWGFQDTADFPQKNVLFHILQPQCKESGVSHGDYALSGDSEEAQCSPELHEWGSQ